MKSFTESMNMKFGRVEGAHVMTKVNLGLEPYGTLSLICAELDIDLSNVSDEEFEGASILLGDFCRGANDATGYTVSVWFD